MGDDLLGDALRDKHMANGQQQQTEWDASDCNKKGEIVRFLICTFNEESSNLINGYSTNF